MKLLLARIFTFILTPLRLVMLAHFKYLAKLVNHYGKDNLPWWVKYLVLDFVWLDIKGNYLFSAQFMDWPASADETITNRLKRYKKLYLYTDGIPKRGLTPIQKHRLSWALDTCKKLSEYEGKVHC